jgi:hypothetical protein
MPDIIPYELDDSFTMLAGDFTVVPFDLYAGETDFTVVDLGPAGIIPPVASFHTVSLLSQRVIALSSDITIDRTLGEYVVLMVGRNITSLQILNWPPAPFLGRIMLECSNQGNYTIQWPDWIKWSRGRAPDLTIEGIDRFLFTSVDQGATVYGDIVGMDYVHV